MTKNQSLMLVLVCCCMFFCSQVVFGQTATTQQEASLTAFEWSTGLADMMMQNGSTYGVTAEGITVRDLPDEARLLLDVMVEAQSATSGIPGINPGEMDDAVLHLVAGDDGVTTLNLELVRGENTRRMSWIRALETGPDGLPLPTEGVQ
jgi:hypothetical protein